MLDWYSGFIGYDGMRLSLNSVCEVTPGGEILWQKERRLQVVGSYESKIQLGRVAATADMVKAAERLNLHCCPVCIESSGNPVKFLQGHNVFGPSVRDLGAVLKAMVKEFPDGVRPRDADSPLYPALHRQRVDLNVMVDLGSHRAVHEWLQHAAMFTRSRHKTRAVLLSDRLRGGETVYWGQHSTRWTLKAYCKFCELKQHVPLNPEWKDFLSWAEGQLRIELCLRRPELKERGTLDESLIWEFLKRVEVGIMKKDKDIKGVRLGRAAELTFTKWQAGVDVKHILPQNTFYRHRREILKKLGLDIANIYQEQEAEREVFDLDYLRAHEIKVLPSAFQKHLIEVEASPGWSEK
jgi:phage/plasmid replication protein, gene II/X family